MSEVILATQVIAVILVHKASDIQNAAAGTTSPTSGARPGASRVDMLLLVTLLATLACVATGAVLFVGL